MKVLIPADVPARRLDEVRAIGGGIAVETFSPLAQRPAWARAVEGVSRRCLSYRVHRAVAARLRELPGADLREGVARRAAGAEILLATASIDARLAARLVEALPALRWIHSTTTGVDRFALPELAARGIRLTAPRGVHARRVAEFVMSLVYCDAKRLDEHWRRARSARGGTIRGRELETLTMGIVGYGCIGREVARLGIANGLRVLAHDRAAAAAPALPGVVEVRSLSALLGASDVVVLALPLTDETRGMIGRDAFRAMRRGAVLVNVGRAGTVAEDALLGALRDGTVRHASLDVLAEDDEAPRGHPLRREPAVLYTHHSAAASPRSDDEVFAGFLANLRRYRAGQPLEGGVAPAAVARARAEGT
jgi:phosphoglycerate dehydrogenase-like enzyme